VAAAILPDRGGVPPALGGRRIQIKIVEIVDVTIELFGDPVFIRSEGGETEGLEEGGLGRILALPRKRTAREDGIVDARAGHGGLVIVHRLEVAGETELGGEGAQQVREEAVERAEKEPRHPRDEDAEEARVILRCERGEDGCERILAISGEGGGLFRIGGRLGQLHEDGIEEFPRRLLREGRREDALGRDRPGRCGAAAPSGRCSGS
jgi:hypothetical protein